MIDLKETFSEEEKQKLSVRAVNELIAASQTGQLMENKELAEVIAGCIRHTTLSQLQTLDWLLKQRALESPARGLRDLTDEELEQRLKALNEKDQAPSNSTSSAA